MIIVMIWGLHFYWDLNQVGIKTSSKIICADDQIYKKLSEEEMMNSFFLSQSKESRRGERELNNPKIIRKLMKITKRLKPAFVYKIFSSNTNGKALTKNLKRKHAHVNGCSRNTCD